jgi:site-specific DNA recombinase
MLSNRYYIGIVTWRDVEYPGSHEPLIELDLFARVQSVLQSRNVAGEKQRVHHHYLKGTVFCGRCERRLVITYAKGQYLYSFCSGRRSRSNPCPQRHVLVERIETAVERFYETIQLEPQRVAEIRAAIERQFEADQQRAQRDAERQRRRIARLQDERLKLLQAHYADAIPLDLLKVEQARIAQEVHDAERAVTASETRSQDLLETLREALALAGSCRDAYRRADARIRRLFNQAFFDKLYLHDDEIARADLAEPFAELLAHDLAERVVRENREPTYARSSNVIDLASPNSPDT